MRHRLRASGLRVRLALALAGVAVISVALATVLANAGLDSRLRDAADARLRESARHSAALAAEIYARDRGWTRRGAAELRHLAEMNGYRFALRDRDGRTLVRAAGTGDRARAPVQVGGATVGVVEVAPVGGTADRRGSSPAQPAQPRSSARGPARARDRCRGRCALGATAGRCAA